MVGALMAAALAFGSAEAAGPQGPDAPSENEVKAAFLFHFAQLVTWPDPAHAPGEAPPIVIGVVGRDPFGRVLEATIGRETVRGRPLRIVRFAQVPTEPAQLPHILYVAAGDVDDAVRTVTALSSAPVLTVSTVKGFAQRGGMVEFKITPDARVAFDINLRTVERAGLKMSSQLLKIARIVEERP
jgi:hypothetical protein